MDKKKVIGFSIFFSFLLALFFSPLCVFAGGGFGWLPPNINPAYGNTIDHLYKVIMIIVAVIFFLTEGALLLFIVVFRHRKGRKAVYSHGSKGAEIIWTVIPAIILIWLALYQKSSWSYIKEQFPSLAESLVIQSFPEQFAWNFRYSGPSGKFGNPDNVITINSLYVPVNKKVLLKMSSKDVIHSFFIPYARIKQDVVPGMMTRAWFESDKIACWDLKTQQMVMFSDTEIRDKKVALDGFDFDYEILNMAGDRKSSYKPSPDQKTCNLFYQSKIKKAPLNQAEYVLHHFDIACSQLCGLGHYRMRGQLIVEPAEVFEAQMKDMLKDKTRDTTAIYKKWNNVWDKGYPAYYNE